MKIRLLGCLSILIISGCSSIATVNPPAELVELEQTVSISQVWKGQVGSGIQEKDLKLAPSVYEGQIFAADRNGLVKAMDAETGKRLWDVETHLPLSGGPGVGDGLIALGTSNGELIALDITNGEELWRTSVSSEVLSIPAIGNGLVVIHTNDDKVIAFDVSEGKQVWVYEKDLPVLTLRGAGSPIFSETNVVVGFSSGKLVALDISDGLPQWEANITTPRGRSVLERMADIDATPIIRDGVIYAVTYQGNLAAVSEDTGTVLWQRELSSHAGLDADWRYIYVTDADDNIWAIDPSNGAALWKQTKLHGRHLTAPTVIDDYIVVGDFEGYLHWLATDDGRLSGRTRIGSESISEAAINNNGILYIYGDEGTLSAIGSPPPPENNEKAE